MTIEKYGLPRTDVSISKLGGRGDGLVQKNCSGVVSLGGEVYDKGRPFSRATKGGYVTSMGLNNLI